MWQHHWRINIIGGQGTLREWNNDYILITQDAIRRRPLQEKWQMATAPVCLIHVIRPTMQSVTSCYSAASRKTCKETTIILAT
jgi:hypothetical protein